MMKKLIFISLLTSTLFAEQDGVVSDFLVEQNVQEVSNESGFGKKSTYSLLFAKHQISSNSQDLHFYYGAKMGLVNEAYTTDNGFGIPLQEIGAYYAATVGMEYDVNKEAVLVAEALRAEDEVYQRSESKVQFTYTYSY